MKRIMAHHDTDDAQRIFSGEALLHAHRFLLRAGLALGNLFAWIFVFEFVYGISGDSARALAAVALLYALTQIITLAATPIAAAHLRRGTKHSLMWGVVFCTAGFVTLGATLSGAFSFPPLFGLAGFAVLLGVYRALYFIPYRLIESATLKPHFHVRMVLEVLIALMPLFAGLTIAGLVDAPLRLLYGAAALFVLSLLPALFLPSMGERFSWPYTYTIAQLWKRKNHALVLHSMFDGIQGATLFIVWPLAIFLILEGSYLTLGLVFTSTLLFVMLLRKMYGWIANRLLLEESSPVHVAIAVSGWVLRLAAGSPIGIIVADVYAYAAQPARSTSADPFVFEQNADRGSFLDEYTALKEMSLALGRIMVCALLVFLAFAVPLTLVFAVSLAVSAIVSAINMVLGKRLTQGTF